MASPRSIAAALAIVCGFTAGGCVMVGRAAPLPPVPPVAAEVPDVEYALGAFTFQMNEGEVKASYFDARLLGSGIFDVWEERGYIASAERVDADPPATASPRAVYHITLSGSVHAQTSFWAQLLNVLTLLTVPYPVTNRYDVELAVRPPSADVTYVARAQTMDEIWVGILLIVGAPFAERGHNEEVMRLADTLYADLVAQGAFGTRISSPAP